MAISLPNCLKWFPDQFGKLKIPGVYYADPNGVLAAPTTDLVMDAEGNLSPAPVDTNNNPVVSLPGSTLAEQQNQTNGIGGVLTFGANIVAVEIFNTDQVNTGVFTVNGIAITVPPGVAFGPQLIGGTPGDTVTISGSTTYIVNRYV